MHLFYLIQRRERWLGFEGFLVLYAARPFPLIDCTFLLFVNQKKRRVAGSGRFAQLCQIIVFTMGFSGWPLVIIQRLGVLDLSDSLHMASVL
jgi:hypothetical protein